MLRVVVVLGVLATGCDDSSGLGRSRDERAFESRLLAPCCWVQTLDVHESELASALRLEIGERRTRGEPEQEIEDDLALRFGARIRAVPRGRDPRALLPASVALGMFASLLALLSWTRRVREPAATFALDAEFASACERDEYDARIDADCARMDQ